MADLYRSQDIAYWFLRLNGFFTIPNFVVHPVLRRHPAETDGDLLGIRFPNRLEMRGFDVPLIDHPVFTDCDERVDFVIAEVKHGPCALNDTWTDASRRVIQYTLDAAGIIDPEDVDAAAAELYARGHYDNGACRVAGALHAPSAYFPLRQPSLRFVLVASSTLPILAERDDGVAAERTR